MTEYDDLPLMAQPIEEAGEPISEVLTKLDEYSKAENIAALLEEEELGEIGRMVVDDYETDLGTCGDWYEANRKALDLAKLVAKKKSHPWENASNLVVPLIARSAIMFNAKTYPELMRNGAVAKGFVGQTDSEKQLQADAQADVINYQCLKEMPEWETDTD